MRKRKDVKKEIILDKELKEELSRIGSPNERIILTSEETEILERVQKFKPDLKGKDLGEIIKYIHLLDEGRLFQAATYSSAYGWPFDESAKLVIAGFEYDRAHEIYTMMEGSGIPLKEAKKWVARGYDNKTINNMISIKRKHGIDENEALKMAENFGEIAGRVIESGWRPYQNPNIDIKFLTIKSSKYNGWLIVANMEDDSQEELTGRLIDVISGGAKLDLAPLSSNSDIYFVDTDISLKDSKDELSPYIGSVGSNMIRTSFEDTRKDPHNYEHMDTTRPSEVFQFH